MSGLVRHFPYTSASQREGLTCGDSSVSCLSSVIGWQQIVLGGCLFSQMDNLNIHRHLVIDSLIHIRGQCVVFCVPYWSCNGAIEFVFKCKRCE